MNFISLRASVNKAISSIPFMSTPLSDALANIKESTSSNGIFPLSSLLNRMNIENDTDIKNRVITGCLVFSALEQLAKTDTTLLTQISDKALELAKVYKGIVENLSKKYISYKEIYTYLRNQEVNEFIKIKKEQIDYVMRLYENKQEIRKFSVKEYSQYMYNIMFITNTENVYLKNIHYNVLVPLVEHYITYNGINEKDVSVENVYNVSPGKVIKFAIRNISCGKIYHDIENNLVGNKKYIYKTELTDDGFLMITMN